MSRYRQFPSGATRDTEEGKLDYSGFLSPAVLERFAQYMNKHRVRGDGSVREANDWKKGMPDDVYLKSLLRHTMDVWKAILEEGTPNEDIEEALCAVIFNAQGILHNRCVRLREDISPMQDDDVDWLLKQYIKARNQSFS